MRTLGAAVAGIAAHFGVAFVLALLLVANTEVVTPEDPGLTDPPAESEAIVIWVLNLAVCLLPAVAGGAVAGKLARENWLPPSGLVGGLASVHAFTLLEGARDEGAYLMVAVVVTSAFAAALLAGSVSGGRRRAAAS